MMYDFLSPGVGLRRLRAGLLDGFLPYALLLGVVFAVYANVYGNGFLYDDESLIVHNLFLRSWRALPAAFVSNVTAGSNLAGTYYRPLQTLAYMVVFQLAGLSLAGFHLLNVGLHGVNACLVYRLGRGLAFKPLACLAAAAIWAVHPLHTEAVTYMSATADTLYSGFCLMGMITLLPDFSMKRVALAMPWLVLGLLSKESAVCFPFLAASCLYYRAGWAGEKGKADSRFFLKTYAVLAPLLGLVGLYVLGRAWIAPQLFLAPHATPSPAGLGSGLGGGGGNRYVMFAALFDYTKWLFIPTNLHMGHEMATNLHFWNGRVLAGIGLLLAGTAQVMQGGQQARKSLAFSWGLCWFIAALLPVLFIDSIFYEHWLYLPSAGLFLGLAQSVAMGLEGAAAMPATPLPRLLPLGVGAGVGLIVGILGLLTLQQNTVWREPIGFYQHIFAAGEPAANAHANLGVIYIHKGDYANGIAEMQRAITHSHDTSPAAQANLAIVEMMQADEATHRGEILSHLQRALSLDPHFYPALDAFASFYQRLGDAKKAQFYRTQADAVAGGLTGAYGTGAYGGAGDARLP